MSGSSGFPVLAFLGGQFFITVFTDWNMAHCHFAGRKHPCSSTIGSPSSKTVRAMRSLSQQMRPDPENSMLTGKRSTRRSTIVALEAVDGKRVALIVPKGSTLEVISDPTDVIVNVLWQDRALTIYPVDLRDTGKPSIRVGTPGAPAKLNTCPPNIPPHSRFPTNAYVANETAPRTS